MRSPMSNEPIELSLPADPNLIMVIRLTAAGVIARAGVTVDRMDEIKMAVEEACGCLIEQVNPPKRLWLCFQVKDGRLDIRAEARDAGAQAGDVSEAELDVMRCILDALVDHSRFEVRDGWIASVEMQAALTL